MEQLILRERDILVSLSFSLTQSITINALTSHSSKEGQYTHNKGRAEEDEHFYDSTFDDGKRG